MGKTITQRVVIETFSLDNSPNGYNVNHWHKMPGKFVTVNTRKAQTMKHSNHAQHLAIEPANRAPYKTGFYEYVAGACLGAILAVLLLAAFGCLFVPA